MSLIRWAQAKACRIYGLPRWLCMRAMSVVHEGGKLALQLIRSVFGRRCLADLLRIFLLLAICLAVIYGSIVL